MTTLDDLIERIRRDRKLDKEIPGFDPKNGNEVAKYLLLLEAPGPKAIESRVVSFDNKDQTAANLKEQLTKAGIDRSDIVVWNIVPWYLGEDDMKKIRSAKSGDITQCLNYLGDLVRILKNIQCIVLMGSAARKAHVYLSYTTDVRILSCHHPSPRVKNFSPTSFDENVAVFKAMAHLRATDEFVL